MGDKAAILAEAVERGMIRVSLKTGREIIGAVDAYNRRLPELRKGMRLLKEIEYGYFGFNPLFFIAMTATSFAHIFENVPLALTVIAFYVAAFIYFAIYKRDLLVSALCTAALLILDWRFAIMLAANIALGLMHLPTRRTLKNEMGYPDFLSIHIIYEDDL